MYRYLLLRSACLSLCNKSNLCLYLPLFQAKMDDGAIIAQDSVPVLVGDSVDILQERVKKTEHRVYPMALELVAREEAVFNSAKNAVLWKQPKAEI